MTDFSTCSICNKPLGGRYRFKESRVGIFRPIVKEGEIVCFAMREERFALCKSCTQSLYSWIKNRRAKCQEISEKQDKVNPQFLSKAEERRHDSLFDQVTFGRGRVFCSNEEMEDN